MQSQHWLILAISILGSSVGIAYASTPDESICWANPDARLCGLLDNPFSVILTPFDVIVPGFGIILLWGPLVFGLWFKTKSPAIAGIFGIILISVLTGLNPQAVGIGLVLIAVSAGIGLIQIFQRIKQTA
jgi:hypothetical protein